MKPTVKLSVQTRSRSRQEDRQEERPLEEEVRVRESGGEEESTVLDQFAQQLVLTPIESESEELDSDLRIPQNSLASSSEEEGDWEEMAEARGPVITPGKFHGGVEENVEEYLTQFERIAKANGWNDNKKKDILPCYLEGAALKWFENLEGARGNELTWDNIKNGMRETFQGIAWDEQMEYRLRMRMQGEVEPIESYVQDILNLCQKVDHNMPEGTKIRHILRGLRPTLLERVMLMENASVTDLMKNIRKIETARFMAGQRVDHLLTEPAKGALGESRNAARSSLEDQIGELTSELSKLKMQLMDQPRQRRDDERRSPYNTTRGGRQPQSRNNPQTETQDRGNDQPYRGWDRGGRRGYRGVNRGRTRDGRVICYKCNRIGHYAVVCRSNNQGNGQAGH